MELQKTPLSLSLNRLACVASIFLLSSTVAVAQTSLLDSPHKWTGYYVSAGVGMETWVLNNYVSLSGHALTAAQDNGGYGAIGTLMAGYDYQLINATVIGAFVDGTLGSNVTGKTAFPGVEGNISATGNWDIGVRVGQPINFIILPYLTAGYSKAYFSKVNLNIATQPEAASGLTIPGFNASGWFLGAGLEAQIVSNWSLRGEYRYASYSRQTIPINGLIAGLPATGVTYPTRPVNQTFEAIVTYKI